MEPIPAYQGPRMVHSADQSEHIFWKSAIDGFCHSPRLPVVCCELPETQTSRLHTSGLYMKKVKDSCDDEVQSREADEVQTKPPVAPQMFMKKVKHFFDHE